MQHCQYGRNTYQYWQLLQIHHKCTVCPYSTPILKTDSFPSQPQEITSDNRWHTLFVKMASKCAPYAAYDETAKASATAFETKLKNPGGLPVFTDTVMAGPAFR